LPFKCNLQRYTAGAAAGVGGGFGGFVSSLMTSAATIDPKTAVGLCTLESG
jgi:hypothetical protein